MSSVTPVILPSSRPRPPKLNDSARFVRVDKVPIIDVCERSYTKYDPETGKEIKIQESIDRQQLQRILENSRYRESKQEYGLVFIGHTNDEGKEIDQPPTVGYLANYELGEHEGNPAILADIYIDREECDPSKTLRQFPRRSAEVIAISKPTGYIDSVALLKRTPERPLGLVTSQYSKQSNVYRFECPACEKDNAKELHKKQKLGIAKNVLKLSEQLLTHLIEEQGNEDDSSDSSGEPSMPTAEKTQKARYRRAPLKEDAEPSEESGNDPSGKPGAKNRRKEHYEPSRMDPSEPSKMKKSKMEHESSSSSEPSAESSSSSSSEPSMPKKSKMAAGGGEFPAAGYPGSTTNTPTGSKMADPSRTPAKVEAKAKKAKFSSRDDVTRMRDDDLRIENSRFKRRIEQLESQFTDLANERFAATIERKLSQLQAEGFEIDRADEVTRFQKYFDNDEDVDTEIARMRKTYKQSPVNQPPMPSFSDMGGNSVPRAKSLAQLMEPLPEDNDPRNPVHAPIIGSGIARMASREGKIPMPEGPNRKKGINMDDISRFVMEKSGKQ